MLVHDVHWKRVKDNLLIEIRSLHFCTQPSTHRNFQSQKFLVILSNALITICIFQAHLCNKHYILLSVYILLRVYRYIMIM